MLLVVAHPVVGPGLETLLRLEDRYEVRRAVHLDQADTLIASWAPDVALIDGVLLRDAERVSLGVPALVLSGSPVDAAGLQQRLDDPRGWLRKDPTPAELRAAVDRLARPHARPKGGRLTVLAAALTAATITVAVAWVFLALWPTG